MKTQCGQYEGDYLCLPVFVPALADSRLCTVSLAEFPVSNFDGNAYGRSSVPWALGGQGGDDGLTVYLAFSTGSRVYQFSISDLNPQIEIYPTD